MPSDPPASPEPVDRTFANCLARRHRLFAIHRTVTLGKTNALGGAYFAEFFAWCGEAREEMLARLGGPPAGLGIHTSEASIKFLRELMPFDVFDVVVWPRLERMHLSLRFFFVRGEQLVAVGDQQICLKSGAQIVPPGQVLGEFISQFDPPER